MALQELSVAEQRARGARRQPREVRFVDGETEHFVVDDPRCDPVFEDAEAERRRELWEAQTGQRDRDRQADREALTLGVRLDRVLAQLAAISTAPARRIAHEPGSTADPEQVGPPKVNTPQVEPHLRVIEHKVRELERMLDHERGAFRQQYARMDGFDKDRIIWDDFQGVRSGDVARAAPYLGTSARTIERARKREAEKRGVVVRLVDGIVTGDAPHRAP